MPPALSEMRLAGSRAQAVFRTKQLSEVSLKKKKKRKRTRISDSLLINWSKTRSNQKLPHVQSVCITLVEDCCNMHAENFK